MFKKIENMRCMTVHLGDVPPIGPWASINSPIDPIDPQVVSEYPLKVTVMQNHTH